MLLTAEVELCSTLSTSFSNIQGVQFLGSYFPDSLCHRPSCRFLVGDSWTLYLIVALMMHRKQFHHWNTKCEPTNHNSIQCNLFIMSIIGRSHLCCNVLFQRYKIYVIVITWAWVICLKYTHEHDGPQGPSASVYISGKSQVPMLLLIYSTALIAYQKRHKLRWTYYIDNLEKFDYGLAARTL